MHVGRAAQDLLAGLSPSQGVELCTVVEAMYSLELAAAITGDAAIADRIERIAYNALPGTFSDDMWAHQYDQQPNQIKCSLAKGPWTSNGPEANLFGLDPNFGCCTANFHQGWPKLNDSLWMATKDGGLAALIYAFCATGIGMLASTFTRSQIAAMFFAIIGTMIPAVQFCGMLVPVSSLEGSARLAGMAYPATHMLTISRGVFNKALGLHDLGASFWPMLVAVPVIFCATAALLKKQER